MVFASTVEEARSKKRRFSMHLVIQSWNEVTETGKFIADSIVLKLCKDQISKPLVKIVNKPFQQGSFPDGLKTSKVIHKFIRKMKLIW